MVNSPEVDWGRLQQRVSESPELDRFHPFAEDGWIVVKCWITADKTDSMHRKQIPL